MIQIKGKSVIQFFFDLDQLFSGFAQKLIYYLKLDLILITLIVYAIIIEKIIFLLKIYSYTRIT